MLVRGNNHRSGTLAGNQSAATVTTGDYLPNPVDAKENVAATHMGMYARGTGSTRLTATCDSPVTKLTLRWTIDDRSIVTGRSEQIGTVAQARLSGASNSNMRGGWDHGLQPAVMSYW